MSEGDEENDSDRVKPLEPDITSFIGYNIFFSNELQSMKH